MTVMISYRASDQALAEEIFVLLKSAGVKAWIDRSGISPGTKWREELMHQFQSCEACVPLLSKAYLASEHCRMELFIARSFERRVLPVMINDCWNALDADESTRGLRDTFMVRLHDLSMAGLPVTRDEALSRLVSAAARPLPKLPKSVFISHVNRDAVLATAMARDLRAQRIPAWVATLDTPVGENWRQTQVRAMSAASCQLVILNTGITQNPILRTELLLSEALGIPVFTAYHPEIVGNQSKIAAINTELRAADLSYRRLYDITAFSLQKGSPAAPQDLLEILWGAQRKR
ncbi:MAG: toll/interleukin-1 receptor domain-containing protein [Hyphomonadaceae bacterium]|nr:toll/interleukin-1 receptor domain-containing protein [Hyphomonadaceae bacterium]